MRPTTLAAGLVCLLAACGDSREHTTPARAVTETSWRTLGTWSGRGDRQTESFDVTSGALRITWEAAGGPTTTGEALRVALHSAISGRPLQTVVDSYGPGSDTVRIAVNPRVAYLLIESDQLDWRVTVDEGFSTASD